MKLTLVMALTLDGKIGRNEAHFPDWTGCADKKMFKKISSNAGAVIMGSRTFDVIGKPLPGRKNIVMTRDVHRISRWDNLIFTDSPPNDILQMLLEEGYSEVVLAGGARINTLFAREKLIDEFVITFSPLVFGSGISLFSGIVDMRLRLIESRNLDANTIWARYEVLK